MDDFDALHIADGVIQRFVYESPDLQVHVKDWREQVLTLAFKDVIGLEGINVGYGDLSHATEEGRGSFLERCCAVAGEAASEFRCYSFFWADPEESTLRIVARCCVLVQASDG